MLPDTDLYARFQRKVSKHHCVCLPQYEQRVCYLCLINVFSHQQAFSHEYYIIECAYIISAYGDYLVHLTLGCLHRFGSPFVRNVCESMPRFLHMYQGYGNLAISLCKVISMLFAGCTVINIVFSL